MSTGLSRRRRMWFECRARATPLACYASARPINIFCTSDVPS
jgi:hypothetical protein